MKKIAKSIAGGSYTQVNAFPQRKEFYSDIDPNFKIDPRTNDVAKISNVESVQSSMLTIISTRKGERPFEPEFGCDIPNSLFENIGDFSAYTIENSIKQAITNYEPRVRIKRILVKPSIDTNTYYVSIDYHIITDLSVIYTIKLNLKGESNGN